VGGCIAECIPWCREHGSEFLFRVRSLGDGSAVVRITLGDGTTQQVRGRGATLRMVQMLWPVLEASAGLLSGRQQTALIRQLQQLTGARRERTYPGAVRQPVQKWPRLRHNRYQRGTAKIEILRIKS